VPPRRFGDLRRCVCRDFRESGNKGQREGAGFCRGQVSHLVGKSVSACGREFLGGEATSRAVRPHYGSNPVMRGPLAASSKGSREKSSQAVILKNSQRGGNLLTSRPFQNAQCDNYYAQITLDFLFYDTRKGGSKGTS
jgi:hypothetical protein